LAAAVFMSTIRGGRKSWGKSNGTALASSSLKSARNGIVKFMRAAGAYLRDIGKASRLSHESVRKICADVPVPARMHSAETREKISAANRGRRLSEENQSPDIRPPKR
jgi:hypothetical protein